MDSATFIRGVLVGLSVAAPVGPMGVLCIRRTLALGRRIGLATGLGVATADASYAAVAAFGLTAVSGLLLREQTPIRLIGGLFLCYLGLKTIRAAPAVGTVPDAGATPIGAYSSAVGLTLTNPLTILTFMGIFAGVGTGAGRAWGSAAALVLGVLLGSALWWVILSNGVALLRDRLTPRALRWVNVGSGCILAGFGALAIASVV